MLVAVVSPGTTIKRLAARNWWALSTAASASSLSLLSLSSKACLLFSISDTISITGPWAVLDVEGGAEVVEDGTIWKPVDLVVVDGALVLYGMSEREEEEEEGDRLWDSEIWPEMEGRGNGWEILEETLVAPTDDEGWESVERRDTIWVEEDTIWGEEEEGVVSEERAAVLEEEEVTGGLVGVKSNTLSNDWLKLNMEGRFSCLGWKTIKN